MQIFVKGLYASQINKKKIKTDPKTVASICSEMGFQGNLVTIFIMYYREIQRWDCDSNGLVCVLPEFPDLVGSGREAKRAIKRETFCQTCRTAFSKK